MKIQLDTDTLKPMIDWLKERKAGNCDENRLRDILMMPEYQVEFKRYGNKNLPVCTLTYEEAVDFFLHFDQKEFENPRLQMKQPVFRSFYDHMDEQMEKVTMFTEINSEDEKRILFLLQNALPDSLLSEIDAYRIIITASIGNSQGYPSDQNIVFDVTNLDVFPDKNTIVEVLAHEIHHTLFGYLLPEEMESQDLFVLNFAFEGLAVHFCNNASTKLKSRKYSDSPSRGISEQDFNLYDEEYDELFAEFKQDFYNAKELSGDKVTELVASHYEQFEYVSRKDGSAHKISQYPTYYLGCYIWGSIELAFEKEVLFDTMKNPSKFAKVYNDAARKLGNENYLI